MNIMRKTFLYVAAVFALSGCDGYNNGSVKVETNDNNQVRAFPEAGVVIKNYSDGYKIVVDFNEDKISKVFTEIAQGNFSSNSAASSFGILMDIKDIKDSALARDIKDLRVYYDKMKQK